MKPRLGAASITKKQIEYLQILSNDLRFDRRTQDAHIRSIINAPWDGDLNRLTKVEAIAVITKFKEWKENQK